MLLVPVPEAAPAVEDWRARYDPSAAAGAPPHITVLYPFLPTFQLTPEILGKVRALVADQPAFDFDLAGLCAFPDVAYAAPDPAGPFTALTEAMQAAFPDARPYGGAFSQVVPHLTLAHRSQLSGMDDWPDSMLRAMGEVLPVRCRANEVWLMALRGSWRLRARFELGASGATTAAPQPELAWA